MRGFFVDFLFFFNSALLGVGLAMDAFSVSAANGLAEPNMKKSKEFSISGTFAFFQFLMPMLGWVFVRFAAEQFTAFQKAVPYIALVLLLFIGGKMLYEGIKNKGGNDINGENGEKGEEATAVTKLTLLRLLVQGIATSIDALSVGFTIAEYKVAEALVCSAIVAAVTFGICVAGTYIGKKFGTKLAGKATILGGVILIIIGLEIFIKGVII
ncbi:MAG: manganese efflux pump [Clostridia bacterium]|nr:manganese efflux pump [Clostridia bacterium]